MTIASRLESGYDFITIYFKTHKEMTIAAKKLHRFCTRFPPNRLDIEIQRKDFRHNLGDIPHFHNGVAQHEPHFHIIYTDRPIAEDWEELRSLSDHVLVGIELQDNTTNQEIS